MSASGKATAEHGCEPDRRRLEHLTLTLQGLRLLIPRAKGDEEGRGMELGIPRCTPKPYLLKAPATILLAAPVTVAAHLAVLATDPLRATAGPNWRQYRLSNHGFVLRRRSPAHHQVVLRRTGYGGAAGARAPPPRPRLPHSGGEGGLGSGE